jgi:hypothetical protein
LWVQQQNRQKSIAPTPGAVLEQFPAELAPGSSDPCSKRRRLGRIMSQWSGRKGRFSSGNQLSRDALELKARSRRFLLPGFFFLCI